MIDGRIIFLEEGKKDFRDVFFLLDRKVTFRGLEMGGNANKLRTDSGRYKGPPSSLSKILENVELVA